MLVFNVLYLIPLMGGDHYAINKVHFIYKNHLQSLYVRLVCMCEYYKYKTPLRRLVSKIWGVSMKAFQKNKINVACRTAIIAMLGLTTAMSAVAAEEENKNKNDQATEVEVIEVTGVRSSLTSAINAKRSNDSISDSIIAEEIGKSSDESIAEALSRVAGVSLDRGSDNQTVTVRGVSAALNDVKMNGISMTSNTNDQAVDLSLFSADILSRIDVIKSPSANQEEGSLGASINLQTLAPLSSKKNAQVLTVEARHNDLSEETTPRFAFNFVQNLNETMGFAGSLFYDKQDIRKDEYQIFSNRLEKYQTKDDPKNKKDQTVYDTDGSLIEGPISAVMPWFSVNRLNLDEKTKMGGTGTFQYRPNEDTDFRFDASFSRNEIDHVHSTARLHNFKNTNNIVTIDQSGESNNVVSAYSQKAAGLNQSGDWLNTTDSLVLGAQFQHTPDDYWTYSGRIGYSLTDQEFTDGYRTAWVHTGIGNATDSSSWCGFDVDEGPQGDKLMVNSYCDQFDPTDPSKMQLSAVRSDRREVDDEKISGYFDVERAIDNSFITSVEFGVKYTDRSKSVYAEEVFLNKGSFENQDKIFASDVSTTSITEGNFLAGIAPSNMVNDWLMPNSAEGVALAFPSGIGEGTINPFTPNPLKAWDVDETTYGAYLQANFEFLDGDISGNFGVRYAVTDINTKGTSGIKFDKNMPFLIDGNEFVLDQVTAEHDYAEFLPSATINWSVSDDVVLRASAARVLARPNINSLRPGYDVKAQNLNETPVASGGNSYLDPFLADQFDLSAEWYFEEGALLSAALFYKDFVSYTYNTTELRELENPLTNQCIVDRVDYEDAEKLTATGPCAEIPYNTTVNGGSADIKGAEIAYQQNYKFLPGLLQYLGSSINYTYADSESIVNPDDSTDVFNGLPFLNTSKNSVNATLFWEDDKTSVRLAYSYRSKALSQTTHFNSSLVRDARETLDIAVNYAITEKLKVTLSANNLTDSYDTFYNVITNPTGNKVIEGDIVKETSNDLSSTSEDRVQALYNTGRNYRLSLRYTF